MDGAGGWGSFCRGEGRGGLSGVCTFGRFVEGGVNGDETKSC